MPVMVTINPGRTFKKKKKLPVPMARTQLVGVKM